MGVLGMKFDNTWNPGSTFTAGSAVLGLLGAIWWVSSVSSDLQFRLGQIEKTVLRHETVIQASRDAVGLQNERTSNQADAIRDMRNASLRTAETLGTIQVDIAGIKSQIYGQNNQGRATYAPPPSPIMPVSPPRERQP